jgi:hypothetical protein
LGGASTQQETQPLCFLLTADRIVEVLFSDLQLNDYCTAHSPIAFALHFRYAASLPFA